MYTQRNIVGHTLDVDPLLNNQSTTFMYSITNLMSKRISHHAMLFYHYYRGAMDRGRKIFEGVLTVTLPNARQYWVKNKELIGSESAYCI